MTSKEWPNGMGFDVVTGNVTIECMRRKSNICAVARFADVPRYMAQFSLDTTPREIATSYSQYRVVWRKIEE